MDQHHDAADAAATPTSQPSPYEGLPYEDEPGYERRWGGLSEEARRAQSQRDPLTFVADHLPHSDRCEGSVVVLLEPDGCGTPLVNVVSDCPRDPTAEECYLLLRTFAEAVRKVRPESGRVAIGLIHHRRGSAVVEPLDRRWFHTVHHVAGQTGLNVLGVLARTASGALVPITDADAEAA